MMNNFNWTLVIFSLVSCFYNCQVGINTNLPSAMLDVVSQGNSSATKAIKISNSSASEIVTVLNNGYVGIGIPNPAAQLHTTNITRMDGLGTNTTNAKVMTADGSGNITTRSTTSLLPQVLAGSDGADAVSSAQTLSSINNTASYTNNLLTKSFTISQTSLVVFSYQLGIDNIVNTSGTNLTDGAEKQLGARLIWKTLPSGSPFTVNDVMSANTLPFTNLSATYSKGTYYPRGKYFVVLNPGSYSIELKGYVFAFDNDQGIKATIGNSPYDRLDIIATPVQ
ncbi:hypothetical protein [Chryseobacterium soli]|uniref:hypothetical protein n=1 Tax=Chryseobacterium soli TaxID=445961 RepID=UPI0029543689|nr:hypothetical protein [Chryseobacterium soli]